MQPQGEDVQKSLCSYKLVTLAMSLSGRYFEKEASSVPSVWNTHGKRQQRARLVFLGMEFCTKIDVANNYATLFS